MNPFLLPDTLLSRVEDAGINASAPPQQRWVDGWLLRFSPGKAKRARCVQAVADGRLPLDERLALCAAVFAEAGLPMVLRLTPFSRPAGLDQHLAALGYHRLDDTRVMVAPQCPSVAEPLPVDLQLQRLDPGEFAEAVGALRGSPAGQREAMAQRLAASPVPYQGWVLRRPEDGAILACAQSATEADLVGLYDVFTHPDARGQGLARRLCGQLLAQARAAGARVAYLQVESDNASARAIYHRLGFADAYAYHYRSRDVSAH
ncbi:MAG: GNAT family N-acetyltransferase [Aquabacterium sp.]|nr:GNAT family N-acetyltransferase [Aquabacterium sp.]